MTNLRGPTKVKCHNMDVLNIKLLLNSTLGLDSSPALASFAHTGWDTCLALLAPLTSLVLKVLLNTTQKVKCLKEVGHLTKSVR